MRPDFKRYSELKAKMRAGEFIPREDFIYVKTIDQISNRSRRIRKFKYNAGSISKNGYRTNPR